MAGLQELLSEDSAVKSEPALTRGRFVTSRPKESFTEVELTMLVGQLPLAGPADDLNAKKDPRETLWVAGATEAEPVIPRCGGVGE
jgi:hypothetical protein